MNSSHSKLLLAFISISLNNKSRHLINFYYLFCKSGFQCDTYSLITDINSSLFITFYLASNSLFRTCIVKGSKLRVRSVNNYSSDSLMILKDVLGE